MADGVCRIRLTQRAIVGVLKGGSTYEQTSGETLV
jgi:hypothetical protein